MSQKEMMHRVSLRPVNRDNWRDIAKLKVSEAQREFVAEPCYYLALCCYGNDWRPLAIYLGEQVSRIHDVGRRSGRWKLLAGRNLCRPGDAETRVWQTSTCKQQSPMLREELWL